MEHLIIEWLNKLKLIVEATGGLLVGIGFILSIRVYLLGLFRNKNNFTKVRLTLARYLVLALEFQLGFSLPDGDFASKTLTRKKLILV